MPIWAHICAYWADYQNKCEDNLVESADFLKQDVWHDPILLFIYTDLPETTIALTIFGGLIQQDRCRKKDPFSDSHLISFWFPD